jgi:hypothetical protein
MRKIEIIFHICGLSCGYEYREIFLGLIQIQYRKVLVRLTAVLKLFIAGVMTMTGLCGCGSGEGVSSNGASTISSAGPSYTGSSAGKVALAWDAASSTNLAGYRVYYGTDSASYMQPKGQGIRVGNVTTYTVSELSTGKIYYFALTAFDKDGNESGYSSEVSKAIP